ncbi:MAG: PqqD family protein [Fimbriimonadaceae bacterium]
MGWLAGIRSLVEGRRPAPLDPASFKSARPVRNPLISEVEGEAGALILEAPFQPTDGRMAHRLAKLMKRRLVKQFELEPVGAFVWRKCDGEHTVEGISRRLREEFKMNRVEADAALTAFLQLLSRRGLITMMVKTQRGRN